MDERMADMAPFHIWKKFLSFLASVGHCAFCWEFGGILKQSQDKVYICAVSRGVCSLCKSSNLCLDDNPCMCEYAFEGKC